MYKTYYTMKNKKHLKEMCDVENLMVFFISVYSQLNPINKRFHAMFMSGKNGFIAFEISEN